MYTVFRSYLSKKLSGDELLSSVDFRRYWLSAMLSNFGSLVGGLALPLCGALVLHATPAQMGILTACQAIPFAFFALPAGVWLDRRRKVPILLGSKVAQAIALAVIPVAYWCGVLSMPWLYAVAATLGTCSVVGGGAEQIFLNMLVGRDRMVEAQSRFAATDSILRLFTPGIAGLLIQWLTAPVAIMVNSMGFVASVWKLRRVHVDEPEPRPSDKHPLHDIAQGFAFIWKHPLLRALAFGAGSWHLLYYGYTALLVLFATRELGMSAGQIGTAHMVGGLGVFVSSMVLRPLNRRYGEGIPILVGTAATVFGFVLMPLIPASLFGSTDASKIAFACLIFTHDCGVMLFFIPYQALRQKVTPDHMMGRMISTMRFLTVAIAPLGALCAGYVADHFSIRTSMACVAVGGLALLLYMLASRPIRSVRP
ncbi:MFS transporter [Massilia endophytica]|uniref:MFS transporter n=1 Tax=Massilia endophytica TaxID=2899220 RepID=UPI001E620286|nr:MFS transporter [Massilia endophytica]UGQ46974.1 MFS transporter [Massilia endophytica]